MRLSTLSYYADFVISIVLIVFLTERSATTNWHFQAAWLGCVIFGFATWTLLEYMIHRWVYHRVPYFRQLHERHHDEPLAFIGAPPLIGVLLIVMIFYAPLMSHSPLIGGGLTTGILSGYCAYQLLHHADHHWSAEPDTWLYRARHFHALHHFHSEEANFRITTSFWDWVFGTAVKSGHSRVV